MLVALKRLALGAIGTFGLLVAIARNRRQKVPPDALKVLKHLAKVKSSSVPELSRRLKLTPDDAGQLLADLEQRGWVQLSGQQGASHVRLAAITKAGREQVVKR